MDGSEDGTLVFDGLPVTVGKSDGISLGMLLSVGLKLGSVVGT